MEARYKIKNAETNEVEIAIGNDIAWFEEMGFTSIGEIERGYDGKYYLIGYAPEQPLDELKAVKLAEVDAWTAAKITGGFVSSASGAPVTYDSDVDTQITMSRIRANCENPRFAELYPDGAPIRGYAQGSYVKQIYMLNAAQIIEWDEDLGVHIGNCKVAGWEKKAEVEAATTKEQLDAIVLA